jgi:glycerophosphoryl diester phosphodiesterase
LKSADVEMPYEGTYTQEDYAQQMIDEYIEAGIDPKSSGHKVSILMM